MENNTENEMFLMSKYKYINKIAKSVAQVASANLTANVTKNLQNGVENGSAKLSKEEEKAKKKADAELAAKLKEEKKKKMAEMCKPGAKNENKTKFVEKEKYVDDTLAGEKKDMSKPMLASYDPQYVEAAWDAWWAKKKFFEVDLKTAAEVPRDKRFVMLLPPPNVTGSLHLGHTLMGAIEDSITRWKRMKGYVSLWVPGTDHAGIATQSVVEKKLLKEQNKYRSDFTREEFLEKVWEWKNEYGHKIFEQFRKLGVSFDLSRNFFTMDDQRSKSVVEAFIQLHERGLLYRAERMVHWCCGLKTAISDVEIEDLELDGPKMLSIPQHKDKYEFGVLIDFAYKLKEDPSKEIIVSTTRIETMLGDVAVCVHPDDPRYKDLIGKELIHPFFPERKLIIIADSILVNMDFGTGAVKITPGHDPNDFACGQRHNLPIITIFNDDGTLNENGAIFKGMKRYDCRNAILKELDKLGLYRGKKPNKMVLQTCSKTGDIIEPMVKPQWWINCKDVAARALEDARTGKLRILPDFQNKMWNEFLGNIRDWCISRQLWWGHRCPVYLVQIEGILDKPDNSNNDHWIAAKSYEDALEKAAKKFNCDKSKIKLTQDEDVLDTWFSSALLPFSVFGWPDMSSEQLKTFFPTDLLETGHDILFFWVARMVFMSYFFLDQLPFHTVFLHPIVRDAQGRKMSKSLGNVIDPLEVINGISLEGLIEKIHQGNLPQNEIAKSIEEKKKEFPKGIPECGADALRLGLMSYLVQGKNINLDISRVISYRFFGNKLWNAVKFMHYYCLKDGQRDYTPVLINSNTQLSYIDKWILNKLSRVIRNYDNSFESYNFGEATNAIYSFWQDNLCDIYVEAVKPVFIAGSQPNASEEVKNASNVSKNVLIKCIESGLKLLHPLMPFISEELYQRLPKDLEFESICISKFPEVEEYFIDDTIEKQADTLFDIYHKILSILTQFQINKIKPNLCIYTEESWLRELINSENLLLATLSRTQNVKIIESKHDPIVQGWLVNVFSSSTDFYLDLKDLIDVNKEVERLNKNLKEKEKFKEELEKKIANYGPKVPEETKQVNSEKLNNTIIEIEKINASIRSLQGINAKI